MTDEREMTKNRPLLEMCAEFKSGRLSTICLRQPQLDYPSSPSPN